MIKNEYLEKYLRKKKKLSEFDKEKYAHDDDRLINLQRPLSERGISQLSKDIFKIFLNDLIYNKETNKLLYSGNAQKELSYSIKQINLVSNATKYYFKRNSFSSKGKEAQNLFFKKKKAEMFEIIKKHILEYKINKIKRKNILDNKNKKFEKLNKKEIERQKNKENKKDNELKIEGYKRAIDTCLNKSLLNNKFELPDNSFDINNVFNRLYNNVILNPINLNIKKNSKKTETTYYNSNSNNNNNITKIRKIKIENNNKKKYLSSEKINTYSNNNNLYRGIKNTYDNYKIRNILKGYNGKEFSTEKNFIDYTKCIKKISGGPKIKRKLYNKIIKRIISEKKIKNLKEKEFNIDSYRDKDNNSFLNIAVKKNNSKFVKYFLNKNYNPNEQNKNGNTALHLSMKKKNRKIIKLLLDKNADLTIKNKEGMTSYDLADIDLRNEFKLENLLILKRPKKYYY